MTDALEAIHARVSELEKCTPAAKVHLVWTSHNGHITDVDVKTVPSDAHVSRADVDKCVVDVLTGSPATANGRCKAIFDVGGQAP